MWVLQRRLWEGVNIGKDEFSNELNCFMKMMHELFWSKASKALLLINLLKSLAMVVVIE